MISVWCYKETELCNFYWCQLHFACPSCLVLRDFILEGEEIVFLVCISSYLLPVSHMASFGHRIGVWMSLWICLNCTVGTSCEAPQGTCFLVVAPACGWSVCWLPPAHKSLLLEGGDSEHPSLTELWPCLWVYGSVCLLHTRAGQPIAHICGSDLGWLIISLIILCLLAGE